jgi:hypothetical protein
MNKFTHATRCIHNVFMNALTIERRGMQRYLYVIVGETNAHEKKDIKIDWIYIALYILKITFKPLFIMPQCVHEHIVNTLIKMLLIPLLAMAKVFITLREYINNISGSAVPPCLILIQAVV